ncbi:MAG: hypothetical protein ACO26H_03255 [Sediminibacterium sp.]
MILYIKPSRYLTAEKREALYNAGSLFLEELMGGKSRKIEVLVSVKGAGLNKDVDGYCLCTEEYDNGKPREFEVDIRGDRGLDFAIKCMAHEFVHIWQMCTGRIDEKTYHKTQDFYNSPWEIEARELEQPLYELYLKNC